MKNALQWALCTKILISEPSTENRNFSKEIPHYGICCWMSCSPWPEEIPCPYMGAMELIV